VKIWKVILAAVVIFSAGAVTGGLTVKLKSQAPRNISRTYPSPSSARPRGDLADRMQKELNLTPAQREDIDRILRESKERTKKIWESAHDESRNLRNNIRGVLTPEQRAPFEEVFKPRGPFRSGDGKPKEEGRKSDERTNSSSNSNPASQSASPMP